MSWATGAIQTLAKGENAVIRPRGSSMKGKVEDGDTVTVAPIAERVLAKGDIVLVKVAGKVYLHLISAVKGEQYQISNNRNYVNGWVSRKSIYGIATRIEHG